MIRLPPTSISLSANDIAAHLQHIEVRQSLLKQGFRRHEIQKFFREQNERVLEEAGVTEENIRMIPSWVDLATRQQDVSYSGRLCASASISKRVPVSGELPSPQKRHQANEKPNSADQLAGRPQLSFSSQGQPEDSTPDARASSQPSSLAKSPSSMICLSHEAGGESGRMIHTPRQSSLLRFSVNASPGYESEQEQSTPSVPFLPQSTVQCRLRTDSSPSVQSDVDDVFHSSSLLNVFETLAIDESLVPARRPGGNVSTLRGNAREFRPLVSLARFEYASPANSSDESWPATPRIESSAQERTPCTSRIVPTLQSTTRRALQLSDDQRSSSPFEFDLSNRRRSVIPISPELPTMSSTPSTRRANISRTEPRPHRNEFFDGPSFVPYNDSLPANLQPQAPADLSRRLFINELSAAYTDPPGRLHGHDRSLLLHGTHEVETGEQSPTTQAISMRRRRNREFARGARVEGLRINRLRRRLRGGRAPDPTVQLDLDEWWMTDEQTDLWRDDLDADRVGEENFEDLGRVTDTSGAGVRVISGNRRAHGI